MTRIYYHDKAIILTENQKNYPEKALVIKTEDYLFQDLKEKIVNFLNLPDTKYLYLLSANSEQTEQQVFGMFDLLNAGGGLVINDQKHVLLIKRWGVWDFPKGKLEKNEKAKAGALREVEEETAVKADLLTEKPWLTYHIYQKRNRYILKQTWWYAMKAMGEQPLTPQKEEDIEEVSWIPFNQVATYLENSYASLNDLWQRFLADAPTETDF